MSVTGEKVWLRYMVIGFEFVIFHVYFMPTIYA